MVEGLGFRLYGLRVRLIAGYLLASWLADLVAGLGFRVLVFGLGFRVSGSGFRVQGLGFGFWV